LYCNNFVDLLVVDVKDPLQAEVKQRERNYFYSSGYNKDITDYVIGYKQITVTGIITETTFLDLSEYDQLYGNIIVKEIPEELQVDKPYVGFAKIEHEMYTFGYNSLAICSYSSEGFKMTQSSFFDPYNYFFQLCDLQFKDGVIYILGIQGFEYMVYAQRNTCYTYGRKPLDIVSLKNQVNSYVFLYENNIQGITIDLGFNFNSTSSSGATSLMNINDTILALGKQLALYRFGYPPELVKQYPNISGTSMFRDGNVLVIANQQGLSFYDIKDLENIKLMP
jgi:hypothetical protein